MKVISCALGLSLIISSVYLSLEKKNSEVFLKFKRLLNKEQLERYNGIIKEIIVNNSDAVEFNQPIFIIEPT